MLTEHGCKIAPNTYWTHRKRGRSARAERDEQLKPEIVRVYEDNKPANTDVNATLQIAIDKINALTKTPDFLIHTGDLTHLAKPAAALVSGQKPQSTSAFESAMHRQVPTLSPIHW